MKNFPLVKFNELTDAVFTALNPPYIINSNDGRLFVADTEPLDAPPDPDCTRQIFLDLEIQTKPGFPNVYTVSATAGSDSSTGFSRFEFVPEEDTFYIDFNETPVVNPANTWSSAVVEISPINGNPFVTFKPMKGNSMLGRKNHTVNYSRT